MKPIAELKIVFDQRPDSQAVNRVKNAVDNHNFAATGVSAYYPTNLFLKNERDEVLGGLLGMIWGGWLHISFLWVDEVVRGNDWATRLMDQAEAYARERNCHSVTLDTHSFQARPFYEKRGYEVFGTLDDYPKGHKKFFLRKKL